MHRVGYVVSPGFDPMVFATMSAFQFANGAGDDPVYSLHLVSERGGPVETSGGFAVETEPFGEPDFDTVIVGASSMAGTPTSAVLDYLRRAAGTARRIAGPCVGAFALAEAGLLDGRRATTHWAHARAMQARYPAVKVEEDRIFIVDGPVWTSAGMTASLDLALAMVEKDLGAEVARTVARKLVMHHRRAGGQSQFSSLLELEPKSDRVQRALDYAAGNLQSGLTVTELARAAALSPRQFSRAFRAETGQSPAKAVENLRVEAARVLIEQGRHSMDTIASETGFADRERMRRAFLRTLGQPPQTIRRNARAMA